MKDQLNTNEAGSYYLQCKKDHEFSYTFNNGSGWSRESHPENGQFKSDQKYTFVPEDPAIHKNMLYCEELSIAFKRIFIMRLYLSGVLIL